MYGPDTFLLSRLQRSPSLAAASLPKLHGRSKEALKFGVVAWIAWIDDRFRCRTLIRGMRAPNLRG